MPRSRWAMALCEGWNPVLALVNKGLNAEELMKLVKNREIIGIRNYEHVNRLPQELLNSRRVSCYDRPISEAKAGRIIKLSFQNEKTATNRYLALRLKLKTDKALSVRRLAKAVYLFPRNLQEK